MTLEGYLGVAAAVVFWIGLFAWLVIGMWERK